MFLRTGHQSLAVTKTGRQFDAQTGEPVPVLLITQAERSCPYESVPTPILIWKWRRSDKKPRHGCGILHHRRLGSCSGRGAAGAFPMACWSSFGIMFPRDDYVGAVADCGWSFRSGPRTMSFMACLRESSTPENNCRLSRLFNSASRWRWRLRDEVSPLHFLQKTGRGVYLRPGVRLKIL